MLESMLSHIPEAAKSSTAALLYICALLAWGLLAWRVQRNRNLLHHLEKLPPCDRIRALSEEMGGIAPPGLDAEQWIRQRQHSYYFRAIVVAMVLGAALAGLAFYIANATRISAGTLTTPDKVSVTAHGSDSVIVGKMTGGTVIKGEPGSKPDKSHK